MLAVIELDKLKTTLLGFFALLVLPGAALAAPDEALLGAEGPLT